jgi:hypothetical protein
MLKRIFTTVLIIALAQAYAGQMTTAQNALAQEMEKSFDELNYNLNVEWNQTDMVFLEQSMNNFEAQITDLQKKGLTNKELINFTVSRINDKKTQEEVQKIVSVINASNMSSEEARSFAFNQLNNSQSQGANWSGGNLRVRVAFLVAAIVVIAILAEYKNKDEVLTPTPTPTPPPVACCQCSENNVLSIIKPIKNNSFQTQVRNTFFGCCPCGPATI